MLHSPQKSIKFVKFHYFSIKKLKSMRSRLSILNAIFGQKPDFDNTNTLGLPWEYCASTLGVLPPVLWEYCLTTVLLRSTCVFYGRWRYCNNII